MLSQAVCLLRGDRMSKDAGGVFSPRHVRKVRAVPGDIRATRAALMILSVVRAHVSGVKPYRPTVSANFADSGSRLILSTRVCIGFSNSPIKLSSLMDIPRICE